MVALFKDTYEYKNINISNIVKPLLSEEVCVYPHEHIKAMVAQPSSARTMVARNPQLRTLKKLNPTLVKMLKNGKSIDSLIEYIARKDYVRELKNWDSQLDVFGTFFIKYKNLD